MSLTINSFDSMYIIKVLRQIEFKLTDSLPDADYAMHNLTIPLKGKEASFKFRQLPWK